MKQDFRVSERHACGLLQAPRSTQRYRSRKKDPIVLKQRLRELAMDRPRYGYRRLHVLLRREGWRVNHKKLYRLYREEGLSIRSKRRKKRAAQIRLALPEPTSMNQLWSMDFVADSLMDGKKIRALTLIDCFSRESLAIRVDTSIPSAKVTETLDQVIRQRGKPDAIRVDNGTEFTSNHFDAWAYERGIQVDFIQPGRPVENALIESFNGKLREECLNVHWFHSLDEARRLIEDWRREYNEVRPHSSVELPGTEGVRGFAASWLGKRPEMAPRKIADRWTREWGQAHCSPRVGILTSEVDSDPGGSSLRLFRLSSECSRPAA